MAKRLSRMLKMNDIQHVYLHEECEKHPIRNGEFSFGSLKSETDMDINVELMLDKWHDFSQVILKSGSIYLLEACLYENIVRYFFECNYPQHKILDFYQRLMHIMSDLNPAILHLRSSNVRITFERVFPIRGEWWRKLILKDRCRYFVEHGFQTDEDNYRLAEDYQELAIQAFETFQGHKHYIDTYPQKWDLYYPQICSFLEINYYCAPEVATPTLEDYTGTYGILKNTQWHGFTIFISDNRLYCRSFWPYILLEYESEDRFGFQSFPISLNFVRQDGHIHSVLVEGNYDWGLCGQVLSKQYDT